jgi:hypothetical protein
MLFGQGVWLPPLLQDSLLQDTWFAMVLLAGCPALPCALMSITVAAISWLPVQDARRGCPCQDATVPV